MIFVNSAYSEETIDENITEKIQGYDLRGVSVNSQYNAKNDNSCLLRVISCVSNPKMKAFVMHSLLANAIKDNFEIDVAYCDKCADLPPSLLNEADIALLDENFLNSGSFSDDESEYKWMRNLYSSNRSCIIVLAGITDSKVRDYLPMCPSAHLRGEQDTVLLKRVCDEWRESIRSNRDILQITTRKGMFAVTLSGLLFCRSEEKYVVMVSETGKVFRKLGKLDDLQLRLPGSFMRIHKSFLVNTQKVTGLDRQSHEIILKGDLRVPYSKAYAHSVSEMYQKSISDVIF